MDFSSTLCWKWLQILVGTFSNYFRYMKCISQLSCRSMGREGCPTHFSTKTRPIGLSVSPNPLHNVRMIRTRLTQSCDYANTARYK